MIPPLSMLDVLCVTSAAIAPCRALANLEQLQPAGYGYSAATGIGLWQARSS